MFDLNSLKDLKTSSKDSKLKNKDLFLNIWFRFVFKNASIVENGNFEYIKKLVKRDISTYSGKVLENLFSELLADSGEYGMIGNYWEKGNANEIDIVALDETNKKILFAEVKLSGKRFSKAVLEEKSAELRKKHQGYLYNYQFLSLENIDDLI
jgi:uncharacterized protein